MTESVAVQPPGTDGSVPLSELAMRYALDTVLYCHTFSLRKAHDTN